MRRQTIVRTITLHDYIVRAGDSMLSIAQKFRVSHETLAHINGLEINEMLTEGQKIHVPILILIYRLRTGESMQSLTESLQISNEQIISFESDEPVLAVLFGRPE